MSKPMGRSDDMLIVKGVNVFPSQIETVLLNKGYPANYQILVDRVNNSDTLDINVGIGPSSSLTIPSRPTPPGRRPWRRPSAPCWASATKVHLVAPKSITRSEGKAVRVIDKRKLHD